RRTETEIREMGIAAARALSHRRTRPPWRHARQRAEVTREDDRSNRRARLLRDVSADARSRNAPEDGGQHDESERCAHDFPPVHWARVHGCEVESCPIARRGLSTHEMNSSWRARRRTQLRCAGRYAACASGKIAAQGLFDAVRLLR